MKIWLKVGIGFFSSRVQRHVESFTLKIVAHKEPLFLREQSKRFLRSALFNDTLFLSKISG
jgi:1-phosphatidylinositol-3-phosphate 5-kinase